MPIVLEPYPTFKNGIHRAIEIDPVRFEEARKALEFARSFGEPQPLVALLKQYVPNTIVSAEQFFESEDGYPHALFMFESLVEALRVPHARDFGIGVIASAHAQNLVFGRALWDDDAPESPAWLEAQPHLPMRVATAEGLLTHLSFEPDLDALATSDVQEAMDLGDLPIPAGDFVGEDAVNDWEAQLGRKLVIYHDHLQRLATRGASVASWYDRKTGDGI